MKTVVQSPQLGIMLLVTELPAKKQLKSAIIWASGTGSEAALEQNLYYLQAKYRTEFAIAVSMSVFTGIEVYQAILHAKNAILIWGGSKATATIVIGGTGGAGSAAGVAIVV